MIHFKLYESSIRGPTVELHPFGIRDAAEGSDSQNIMGRHIAEIA